MKIVPLGDRVVLEVAEKEKGGKRESGLYVPETVRDERSQEGKVIAVGPGKFNEDGERTPMSVKKGDLVLFSTYKQPTKVEGKEYLVISEDEILGILE